MKEQDKKSSQMKDLIELMRRLRAPDGCPWDREQDPQTLTPYIIEEAHELVDAIREKDPPHVCEELGDLLFQIVFQAQIASEEGQFDFYDVVSSIHEKMTRRHPHVFGTAEAKTPADVRKNWVRIKESEGKIEQVSALGKVPRSLPSLLRGRRVTENAAVVGFDWTEVHDVMDKLDEEVAELKSSVAEGDADAMEDEFGDVLFVMVNLSRFLNLDPERALDRTIEKFSRRFMFIEKEGEKSGKKMEDMSIDEMEDLWQEAKGRGL